MPIADTVFVGGGTPTQIDARSLARVLTAIPTVGGAEVTVECNPDDVTGEMMSVYAEAGVDRVSLGVQSMAPHVLVSLGRTHMPENVELAVAAARANGIRRINLDLIYGGAGEKLSDWEHTVGETIALQPDHISAYALTVEAGTPLALEPHRHPDDDDLADKYEIADELFVAAGLANYEVSNWAKPNEECRHNLVYWHQQDYQGFGCAAHSHRDGQRFWNVRTPERYIALVEAGDTVQAAGETLDTEARRMEGLQLQLRLREGVPFEALDGEQLDGLVDLVGQRWVLTQRGRLMANAVALRLK
jgi:putative oxygen-independent coproporphyrinogen III oxidase